METLQVNINRTPKLLEPVQFEDVFLHNPRHQLSFETVHYGLPSIHYRDRFIIDLLSIHYRTNCIGSSQAPHKLISKRSKVVSSLTANFLIERSRWVNCSDFERHHVYEHYKVESPAFAYKLKSFQSIRKNSNSIRQTLSYVFYRTTKNLSQKLCKNKSTSLDDQQLSRRRAVLIS